MRKIWSGRSTIILASLSSPHLGSTKIASVVFDPVIDIVNKHPTKKYWYKEDSYHVDHIKYEWI